MSAAVLTNATRSALGLMVERETRRVGSRDVAYEVVAQTVGASASWIKKFLSMSGEVKEPRITLFLNIRAAYENVCARVEQEQHNQRLANEALRRQLDAVTDGFDPIVPGVARGQTAAQTTAEPLK